MKTRSKVDEKDELDVAEGNTITSAKPTKKKQCVVKNRWCFTYNNGIDEIDEIFSYLEEGDKCIIGKEVGESGTPHLQGYIHFKVKCRPTTRIPIKQIHWESCKGNERSNIIYCSKDNNFKIFNDSLKLPRIRSKLEVIKDEDLYEWEKELIKILDTEPDDRTIHWFSDLGKCNTGKTTFCKYCVVEFEAIMLSGKVADQMNAVVTFVKENKETPDIILINLPKTFNCEFLSYQGLETIKDMIFYSGKYEGGMVCGHCPHLIVMSNELPDVTKCDPARWKVYNIVDNVYMSLDDVKDKVDNSRDCFF